MTSAVLHSNRFRALALVVFLLALSSLWFKKDVIVKSSLGQIICSENSSPSSVVADQPSSPQLRTTRQNIAVASVFGHHFDVYLALAWTLRRVLHDTGKLQVYAETPFGHGFSDIADQLGLYHGDYKLPDDLISDLRANEGSGSIDMVILGTCSVDLNHWQTELLAAWDARDDDHKFKVGCITHHASKQVSWEVHLGPWSRRNALHILPISDHVAIAFRELFKELASSSDPVLRSAAFEYVPVDAHIPILDLSPEAPLLSSAGYLSNAVIQGSFATDRRDYLRLFDDLIHSLHDDPRVWGYMPLAEATSFIEDKNSSDVFKLHLVGSGWLDIPQELKNIIIFHVDLSFHDFYNIIGSMDICVPAFHPLGEYYTLQASSTVVMCSEVNTPLLVTQHFREAYRYIDDDGVLITRPAAMFEIAAIKALRTMNASDFLRSDPSNTGISLGSHASVNRAVKNMMLDGWIRPKANFGEFKRRVWAHNDVAAIHLLA